MKEAKISQGAEPVTPANVESEGTDTARLDYLLMRLNAQHHMPTPGLTRAVLDEIMAADAARPSVEP
jgi:hypothetical protein